MKKNFQVENYPFSDPFCWEDENKYSTKMSLKTAAVVGDFIVIYLESHNVVLTSNIYTASPRLMAIEGFLWRCKTILLPNGNAIGLTQV